MSDTLSNADLKKRFPSMAKQLTVGHADVAPDDPDLGCFVRAADAMGFDVKTANQFLELLIEERKKTAKK